MIQVTEMKEIKTEDAVGAVLCHDITRIVKGSCKGPVFRKGHVIRPEDIPVLLSVGKESVYVWQEDENLLHEDEAAKILAGFCCGRNLLKTAPTEGKISLISEIDGLLTVDDVRLRLVNGFGRMMIATRSSGFRIAKGEVAAATRIIPLVIEKKAMEEVSRLVGDEPIMDVHPFRSLSYGVVTTGSEIFKKRIEDTFTPVIEEKLGEFGSAMKMHVVLDDDDVKITEAIREMDAGGCELIICTGGMSVDPDDRTPLAIKNSGAEIVSYGSPVLPGAMLLISYLSNGTPVLGLPGCVMYSRRTVFDLILPWVMAGIRITSRQLASLGNGGLCLGCDECRFPACSFGKGGF